MPVFYFHRTDGFVDPDETGTEMVDLNAARRAAVLFAAESLRDDPTYVWKGRDFRVEVTDESGRLCLTIVTLAIDAESTILKRLPS